MMQLYDNSTGRIIVNHDGRLMLVDTGAAKTFYDEYRGVRVRALSRLLNRPLDGVLGMDSLEGRVLKLARNRVQFDGEAPANTGAPLEYINGIPCVEIWINEIRGRALIKTGMAASYVSEELISTDKYTRAMDDLHPIHGWFSVRMFANHFRVSDKSYFADVAQLPRGSESLSPVGVDAILGADLLQRFDVILDFSAHRLHLLGRRPAADRRCLAVGSRRL